MLRSRLALKSAAACAKILRLNADEAALRDLRFAVGDALRARGEAPSAVARPRCPAAQPRSTSPPRDSGAARPGSPDPNGLAAGLKACAGEGDPVSGSRKGRRIGLLRLPGRPSRRSRNPRPLGVRYGHRHPAALAAARAADRDENPGPRSEVRRAAGRRARPGDPAWSNAAAGAIALAAASALDLAADLSRRSEILIAVAPKLRSKPAPKIVDLLLSQDCVSPAEAARHAPMTGRAARRLFDRLVALGAAREFSGRPTFRLYGL